MVCAEEAAADPGARVRERGLERAWPPTEVTRGSLTALSLIDTRANLLGASKLLEGVALDKYVFLRDGYLSRRRNLVYDGNLPEDAEKPEASDAPASAAPKSAPK